jgi:hypothetical protein
MFTFIKEYFRKRAQTKAYNKIKAGLLSNPKLLIDTKAKFEKAFGVNQINRTRVQWERLVKVYGVDEVAKKENMTPEEVMSKTKETFRLQVLKELCRN